MNFKNVLAAGAIVVLSSTTTLAVSKFFSDVDKNGWYGPSVEKLSDLGIIKGYSDGTFKPDQKVSRAELAVMLDRVIQYVETGKVEDIEKAYKQTLYLDEDSGDNSHKVILYSDNAKIVNDDSCSDGYYSGDFTLALTSLDEKKTYDSRPLGKIEVPTKQRKAILLEDPTITDREPGMRYLLDYNLIVVEKYENCNGNTFALYSDLMNTDVEAGGKLVPEFIGYESNEFYSDPDKVTFTKDGFKYSSYDNSSGKWTNKEYKYNFEEAYFDEVK